MSRIGQGSHNRTTGKPLFSQLTWDLVTLARQIWLGLWITCIEIGPESTGFQSKKSMQWDINRKVPVQLFHITIKGKNYLFDRNFDCRFLLHYSSDLPQSCCIWIPWLWSFWWTAPHVFYLHFWKLMNPVGITKSWNSHQLFTKFSELRFLQSNLSWRRAYLHVRNLHVKFWGDLPSQFQEKAC